MFGERHLFDDLESLSRALAEAFVDAVTSSASEKFAVALAGGTTPHRFYELLGTEFVARIPWERVHLFWSDERYVPYEDPESNFKMVCDTLLDAAPVPQRNVHAAPTGLPIAGDAATLYEEAIRSVLGAEPRFDWVLLGMGEDGHIASLFPGSPSLDETARLVIAVHGSPKPPPVRLTLSLPVITAARQIHLLVAGTAKAAALERSLAEPPDPELPASRLRPVAEAVHWWVDRHAAGSE